MPDILNDIPQNGQSHLSDKDCQRLENMIQNAVYSRQQFLDKIMDPRRDLDKDCGYKATSELTPELYKEFYDREPLATRVVELMPKECWQTTPIVYEKEEGDEKTQFEIDWDELPKNLQTQSWFEDEEGNAIWEYLRRADIASGIGHFGIILLGTNDGKRFDEPAEGVVDTRYIDPSKGDIPTSNLIEQGIIVDNRSIPKVVGSINPPSSSEASKTPSMPMGADAQYYDYDAFNGPVEYPKAKPKQLKEGEEGEEGEERKLKPKTRELMFLRIFDESSVQITQFESNMANPRYGQPVMYQITFNEDMAHGGIGLPMNTVQVHWSRVIHIADGILSSEVFGVPRMRPCINPIYDAKKVRGAGSEGYLKTCFTHLSFESQPNIPNPKIDRNALRQMVEDLYMSLEKALYTTGMNVRSIAPNVVDPSPHINAAIEAICIVMEVPKRIFVGSERGELSSSQDSDTFQDRKKGRKRYYLIPRLIVAFIDRLISMGCLSEPEQYRVEWDDYTTLNKQVKVQILTAKTQAYASYAGSPMSQLVTKLDYMTKFDDFDEETAQVIIDASEKEQIEAEAEAQALAEEQGLNPMAPEGFQDPNAIPPEQVSSGSQGQGGFPPVANLFSDPLEQAIYKELVANFNKNHDALGKFSISEEGQAVSYNLKSETFIRDVEDEDGTISITKIFKNPSLEDLKNKALVGAKGFIIGKDVYIWKTEEGGDYPHHFSVADSLGIDLEEGEEEKRLRFDYDEEKEKFVVTSTYRVSPKLKSWAEKHGFVANFNPNHDDLGRFARDDVGSPLNLGDKGKWGNKDKTKGGPEKTSTKPVPDEIKVAQVTPEEGEFPEVELPEAKPLPKREAERVIKKESASEAFERILLLKGKLDNKKALSEDEMNSLGEHLLNMTQKDLAYVRKTLEISEGSKFQSNKEYQDAIFKVLKERADKIKKRKEQEEKDKPVPTKGIWGHIKKSLRGIIGNEKETEKLQDVAYIYSVLTSNSNPNHDPKTGQFTNSPTSSSDGYEHIVKTTAGDFELTIDRDDEDGFWEVNFAKVGAKGGGWDDATGEAGGKAVQVFRNIGESLDNFIKKRKPNTFGFTALGNSRVKLYERLASTLAKRNNYNVEIVDKSDTDRPNMKSFVFTKKKKSLWSYITGNAISFSEDFILNSEWDESKVHRAEDGTFASFSGPESIPHESEIEKAINPTTTKSWLGKETKLPSKNVREGPRPGMTIAKIGSKEYLIKVGTDEPIHKQVSEHLASIFAKDTSTEVPPSSLKKINGKHHVITEWVEAPDLKNKELNKTFTSRVEALSKVSKEDISKHLLYDYVIGNPDKHDGNYLLKGNKLIGIDKEFSLDGKTGTEAKVHSPPNYLSDVEGDMHFKISQQVLNTMIYKAENFAAKLKGLGHGNRSYGVQDRIEVLKHFAKLPPDMLTYQNLMDLTFTK